MITSLSEERLNFSTVRRPLSTYVTATPVGPPDQSELLSHLNNELASSTQRAWDRQVSGYVAWNISILAATSNMLKWRNNLHALVLKIHLFVLTRLE